MADRESLKKKYNEEWVMKRRNLNHGLFPIRTVLKNINDPQDRIKVIHVAGTNGKGSTCNYLKDILVSQGYKVGMFTSPHLITHRDRIRINDRYISHDEFENYLLKHIEEIEAFRLGMFEIDTIIAFEWFCDEQVDYAIMECGLGGRLDNTNVISHPALQIITSISYDHMNLLGERLEQIAFEKAGIIQPYSRCLIGLLPKKAERIIRLQAYRKKASLIPMHAFYSIDQDHFRYEKDIYHISTSARYQMHNASLALCAAQLLDIDIHTDVIHEVIKKSSWLGRFETIQEHPLMIIDGAHNEEGIQALCASMKQLPHPLICVFSALKDKQVHRMNMLLKNNCDQLIVTSFQNARADTIEDLMIEGAIEEKNYEKAIALAKEKAGMHGTVVITGSLYFISIVREKYKK